MTAIATFTAEVLTGARVKVTLTWTSITPGDTMTLWRDDLTGAMVEVLGVRGVPVANDVIDDTTAPLNRPVYYVVAVAGAVALSWRTATPVTITADTPVLSEPYSGQLVPVTIKDWPEISYPRRVTGIDVENRPQKVFLYDVEGSPKSDVTLRTDTGPDLLDLRTLVASGVELLIRASCPGVEDTWVMLTGDRKERRLTMNSADHRRHHVWSIEHYLAAPDPDRRATTDTLGDLADAIPGTLGDVAAAWSTLIDIARAALGSS